MVGSSLFASIHDLTDPQLKSYSSFIVDAITKAYKLHEMFYTKHNVERFENDPMFVQIHSSSKTKNEMFRSSCLTTC